MLRSVVGAGMKRKHVLKTGFSLIVIVLVSGILKTSVLNFGTSIMAERVWEKAFAFSLLVTGQKWIFGSISHRKRLISHLYILHTNGKFLTGAVSGLLTRIL